MSKPDKPLGNLFPLAFFTEYEWDHGGDESGPAYAVCSRSYYCPACYFEYEPAHAEAVYNSEDLHSDYVREECCQCGKDFD